MFSARYFAHANVNTVDLDRATDFYESVLGLHSLGPTTPDQGQDGAPFGLAGTEVSWRGCFLADERDLRSPVVDLLEWTAPPTAQPDPAEADAPGLQGLGFAVADLEATIGRLEERGLPVRRGTLVQGDARSEVVLTTDIDGTRIELAQRAVAPRYESIRLVTRDLPAAVAFYRDALHFDHDEPVDHRIEQAGATVEAGRVVRAYLPGQREKFSLLLTEPENAATLPKSTRLGNTARLYRMALLVDDVQEAYADLRTHVPDAAPPIAAHVGAGHQDVPALFFRDADGVVVEYLVGMWSR
ncbi:VOC family protein [Pseudonocardia pini]|uniref:VOC family protein n=1 Tax=Pseudonocardia pini TaxID=2758030 RepID=UPI0015F02262|nr:VOC family protein [Pseudonocardia pini]